MKEDQKKPQNINVRSSAFKSLEKTSNSTLLNKVKQKKRKNSTGSLLQVRKEIKLNLNARLNQLYSQTKHNRMEFSNISHSKRFNSKKKCNCINEFNLTNVAPTTFDPNAVAPTTVVPTVAIPANSQPKTSITIMPYQIKQINLLNESQTKEVEILEIELRKLECTLSDPKMFIYDECFELRRVIQLDKELTIERIQKSSQISIESQSELINEISMESDSMIEQVIQYEKEANSRMSFLESKKFIQTNITPFKNTLSQKYWMTSSELNNDSSIYRHQKNLNDLTIRSKIFIFGNNMIELKEKETKNELKLKYYIYFKQSFALFRQTGFNLFSLNKKTAHRVECSGFKIEIFSDGKYLICCQLEYDEMIDEDKDMFIIYDPNEMKVVKEIIIDHNTNIRNIKINSKFVALDYVENFADKTMITDYDLKTIKIIHNQYQMAGANEEK